MTCPPARFQRGASTRILSLMPASGPEGKLRDVVRYADSYPQLWRTHKRPTGGMLDLLRL
jgi:hypothetical protein